MFLTIYAERNAIEAPPAIDSTPKLERLGTPTSMFVTRVSRGRTEDTNAYPPPKTERMAIISRGVIQRIGGGRGEEMGVEVP